jgi:hypothetical protein
MRAAGEQAGADAAARVAKRFPKGATRLSDQKRGPAKALALPERCDAAFGSEARSGKKPWRFPKARRGFRDAAG